MHICPNCASVVVSFLAWLGSILWARCRDCGSEYVAADKDADDYEEITLEEVEQCSGE